jgi:hypothetical protein
MRTCKAWACVASPQIGTLEESIRLALHAPLGVLAVTRKGACSGLIIHWLGARSTTILRLVLRGQRRAKVFQLLDANLHEHEEVGRLDDSYPNYREVSADVLLIAGGKSDLPWVAPSFDRLTEVLPSARVHTLPKLDHLGPTHKRPAEVAEAVTAFLLS